MKYDITDENENPVFRVEGEFLSFGARLHLYGPDMRELYYVEQELFHFMPRYNIYAGQTSAAAVKKNFTLFGHSLTVESDYGHFEIEGSVFGWDFEILYNGHRGGHYRQGVVVLGGYLPSAHRGWMGGIRVSLCSSGSHRQLYT